MKKELFFFLPLFLLIACGNKSPATTAVDSAAAPSVYVTKKVSDLEPALLNADSLQVLYYDNPDGESLRYTRYFTYTETGDTSLVKKLVAELDQAYVQEPKTRVCRSEGKLYLLKGEDILKTVYFSTRGDTCSYFYFIKDGSFVYVPLTEGGEKILKENKRNARKPKATN